MNGFEQNSDGIVGIKGKEVSALDIERVIEAAKAVGRAIAERAKAAGVSKVAFDRAGFMYHGRIKALADAAREAGLEF